MDPYQDRIYDWLAVDEVEAAAVIERQGTPSILHETFLPLPFTSRISS